MIKKQNNFEQRYKFLTGLAHRVEAGERFNPYKGKGSEEEPIVLDDDEDDIQAQGDSGDKVAPLISSSLKESDSGSNPGMDDQETLKQNDTLENNSDDLEDTSLQAIEPFADVCTEQRSNELEIKALEETISPSLSPQRKRENESQGNFIMALFWERVLIE